MPKCCIMEKNNYRHGLYTILRNEALTANVYRMVLEGDTGFITAPGQFVNIQLEGRFLRRPISICDWDAGTITLIYKVVGGGTRQMSAMPAGTVLDLLTGLGNGFDLKVERMQKPLLVGGGVGVPPLYGLAKKLLAEGFRPAVIMGFNTASEVFCLDEFKALGCQVLLAVADGSAGIKGFVTDALGLVEYDYLYACGPEAMLRALYHGSAADGQFSFEQRMACGFGACMGCSCKTITGYKRICKDGPVMKKEEIIL